MPICSAAIFDMDGLLLDTERIGQLAWTTAAGEFGLDLPEPFYQQLIGRTMADVQPLLAAWLPEDALRTRYLDRCQQLYREAITVRPPPVKPGVERLLAQLAQWGVPRGVATSTRRPAAEYKLRASGLWPSFSTCTTGDQVTRGKPDPQIFRMAAEALGRPITECLVLEDSAAGVRAGQASGATVVMVPDLVPSTPELTALAALVLPSLETLLERIEAGPLPGTFTVRLDGPGSAVGS